MATKIRFNLTWPTFDRAVNKTPFCREDFGNYDNGLLVWRYAIGTVVAGTLVTNGCSRTIVPTEVET